MAESELDEAWKSGFNAGFGEAMITAPQPSDEADTLRAQLAEALDALKAAEDHADDLVSRAEVLVDEGRA